MISKNVSAPVEVPCSRCGGAGFFQCYGHIQGGVCFKCNGRRFVTVAPKAVVTPAERKAAKERKAACEARKAAKDAALTARTRASMAALDKPEYIGSANPETPAQARARVALAEAKARYGAAFGAAR